MVNYQCLDIEKKENEATLKQHFLARWSAPYQRGSEQEKKTKRKFIIEF